MLCKRVMTQLFRCSQVCKIRKWGVIYHHHNANDCVMSALSSIRLNCIKQWVTLSNSKTDPCKKDFKGTLCNFFSSMLHWLLTGRTVLLSFPICPCPPVMHYVTSRSGYDDPREGRLILNSTVYSTHHQLCYRFLHKFYLWRKCFTSHVLNLM